MKNIFKNLLLDLEPFLRKICYLKAGTLFDQYAGFVDVVKEIYYLKSLYFTRQPELEQFKSFYNSIYQWRNDNAHKAPILPDNEVKGAINMVLCIYLYATMVSITDLEANGYELERFDSNVYSLVNNIAAENNN
jgi:type I restriction enzyme R subunit